LIYPKPEALDADHVARSAASRTRLGGGPLKNVIKPHLLLFDEAVGDDLIDGLDGNELFRQAIV
jgi:hypothetical protein